MTDLMNTHEVAEYLRIKERKVYDLVRDKKIPCTRVTGKWLFPKPLIDQWLAEGTELTSNPPPPPVVAGSHDPLLDWALRESASGLAMLGGGSLDGLKRLAAGKAAITGLHVLDADSGEYNVPSVQAAVPGMDVVLIQWAWREQGLVLARGNPLGIGGLKDLKDKKARVVLRQEDAGSRILFSVLLDREGLAIKDLKTLAQPVLSETELGLAVQEGKADAGLAVADAARQYRLDFVPLHRERYDLLIRRRAYFEEPFQTLLEFTRTDPFRDRAREMAGYDISDLGRVIYNA